MVSIVGHLYVKQRSGGEADFARSVRSLVYGFWKGELDLYTFIDTMVFALQRGLMRAWGDGARHCGVQAHELSQAELRLRDDFIASQYGYLVGFAAEIEKNQREKKGKLGPLLGRAELWVGRYTEATYFAMQTSCKDVKLKWRFNPLKEHCMDCFSLDGKVYRASQWAEANLRPRQRSLACKGYRCGCTLEVSDEPLSPGKPRDWL